MEYYAGLFDAEGCVSLTPGGSIKVRLNNTNELVPNLFKEKFGGTVYKESKRKKKTIFSWYLNSENFNNFCSNIIPYSFVKKQQLELLFNYRNSSRLQRRETRKNIVSIISSLKKPIQVSKDYFGESSFITPDPTFYKWFAGFIEGDGSIRLHENNHVPFLFSTQIGAGNTFPEPIKIIHQRIKGSLTKANSPPHVFWKWVCSENCVPDLLNNILPYMITKKKQALLIMDFIEIKKSKHRNERYSFSQGNQIRDIIAQIKHLNSF
jgi:hypothetical protein